MRLLISILFSLICTFSFARTPKEAMARVKAINVPFNDTGTAVSGVLGCSLEVDDGVLSRKVYSNAQLTEWWDMKECPDFSYYCTLQFDIQSHRNNYFLINLNDIGDFRTRILASITPEGNITDYIDASVFASIKLDMVAIMQYRIAANGDVIISRIVPTSSTSIPLDDLKDFHGYRQDTTYRLDQDGKFQTVSIVKYTPQLYTVQMLSAEDYHIWNGNETPVSE